MTDLLRRLALTPPPDPTQETVLAWLDGLADVIAADAARVLKAAVETALEGFSASLTAGGDLTTIDGITGTWEAYVAADLAPAVAGLHSAGSLIAFVTAPGSAALDPLVQAGWAAVVNDAAVAYQAAATNRLAGVGVQVWANVRDVTVRALEQGLTGPQLKTAIQDVTDFSEFRADTVGRTESMSAYNAGDHEGARALGDKGPVEKVWMAAIDKRTRPDHREADGQTVAFDEPFVVGGVQMQHPLAVGAPAEQVVNCRCVTAHLYAGDTRPDGSKVEAKPT